MDTRQPPFPREAKAIVLIEAILAWIILWLCGLPYAEQKFPVFSEYAHFKPAVAPVVLSTFLLLLLALVGFFSFEPRQFALNLRRITQVSLVYNATCIFFLQWSFSGQLALLPYLLQFACQVAGLMLLRRISDQKLKRRVFQTRRHVVIGRQTNPHFIEQLGRYNSGEIVYLGIDDKVASMVQQADYVYLCDDLHQEEKSRLLSMCIGLGKRVALVPRLYEISLQNAESTQIGDVMIFRVERFRLSRFQIAVKRAVDVLLSLCGLILFSPVMLWAAIAIKLEDGGSIFYRQLRVGRQGAVFQIIKFRSMATGAEDATGAVMSANGDRRVTRIGRIMRARRLDEIPQFINVLSGNMSLVGPRPERPEFVREFVLNTPEYNYRLAVKPGMTGLAQIMGSYNTSAENKLKFDLSYIRNYSFLLDAKILLRTPALLFPGKGHARAAGSPVGHDHE